VKRLTLILLLVAGLAYASDRSRHSWPSVGTSAGSGVDIATLCSGPVVGVGGCGFAPLAHFGASVELYYDSEFSVGGPVDSLTDQSHNANDLIGTLTLRPGKVGACSPNFDKSCIRFDGNNDELVIAAIQTITQPYAMFFAWKSNDITSLNYFVDSDGAAAGSNRMALFNSSNNFACFMGLVGNFYTPPNADTHYGVMIVNSASSEYYEENVLVNTMNCGAHTAHAMTMGARFDGTTAGSMDVFQFFIIDGIPTAAEIEDVYNFQVALQQQYDQDDSSHMIAHCHC